MLLARSLSRALTSTLAGGVVLVGAVDAEGDTWVGADDPVGLGDPDGGGVVVLDGAVDAEGAPEVSALGGTSENR